MSLHRAPKESYIPFCSRMRTMHMSTNDNQIRWVSDVQKNCLNKITSLKPLPDKPKPLPSASKINCLIA